MVPLLVLCVLILEAFTPCNGQEILEVPIHMNGVKGKINFVLASQNLTINVTLSESLGAGQVTVEVRPIWVDYDVVDKCSTTQLGTAIPGLAQNVTFTNNAAILVLPYTENHLASLGGYSVVLIGSSKTVCASIESNQNHTTAYAQFQDSLQGTVYFRQAIDKSYIRIVTDLFSIQGPSSSSWFITDTYNNCSMVTPLSELTVYNPKSSSGTGCSTTSQENCAQGELSGKLGNVSIAQNIMGARMAYTDRNLPLLDALKEKLLIITSSNGSRACSVIRVYEARQAEVVFSNDGITGSVSFSQANPFDSTTIHVNLMGLNNMAKGYHVHLWPTPVKIVDGQDLCGPATVSGHLNPYNKNVSDPSYPAPATSTDDMYEVGDLSSKHGTLEALQNISTMYIDFNLPLFGQKGIIGRSLVIHRNDATASRWVCSNIWPVKSAMVAIAVFKYPVIGEVIFMNLDSYSETTVFTRLDYNDGRPPTKNHMWAIKTNPVSNDMLSDDTTRCLSTGSTYNPHGLFVQTNQLQSSDYCRRNSPLGCMLGDLSGRLGLLNIRSAPGTSDTTAKQFFTDVNIPLFGQNSVVDRSVAIMNDQGTTILACANIQYLHEQELEASLSMEGVSGIVLFKQSPGFGIKKTSVLNNLSGMKDGYRLFIYELSPSSESGLRSCSNLGTIYNPLNITQNPTLPTTDDKYMIGDLSRVEKSTHWSSYNLPLDGLTSINGRSLVIVDTANQNKILACAKIVPSDGQAVPMHTIKAVSTFTGAVSGAFHMVQTIYNDGTMSETSILVDLKNENGEKTWYHNWHTHVNPIGMDAHAEQSRCISAGPHFDPYMTMKNLSNYGTECKPSNPLRCELGDQASKLSTYDVGNGGKLFNDVDLPLYGKFSVLGRSMVLHVPFRGAARLACADILPVTDLNITLSFRTANVTNRTDVARVFARAIETDSTNVVVGLLSEAAKETKLNVYFIGIQANDLKSKFEKILQGNDKSSLTPYIPDTTGAANYSGVSLVLLLMVLAVHVLKCL
ncbi:hypothetical protein BsWGS_00626 [Bradybaena similaris]